MVHARRRPTAFGLICVFVSEVLEQVVTNDVPLTAGDSVAVIVHEQRVLDSSNSFTAMVVPVAACWLRGFYRSNGCFRFEIRTLEPHHQNWARAIFAHSNLNVCCSPLWTVVYPDNRTGRAYAVFRATTTTSRTRSTPDSRNTRMST